MPNHFHWLLRVRDDADCAALSKELRILLSSYSRAIQNQEGRTGSLFQQHSQAREVAAESYAPHCFCYIHQNPLRATLVTDAADWVWSSFRDYAGLRSGKLCDKLLAAELLDLPAEPMELRALLLQLLPDDVAAQVY